MIPVVTENAKIRLALPIHSGSPVAVANDAIEMPSVVADNKIFKTSNILTNSYAHWSSFTNFSSKIVFNFMDFFNLNCCWSFKFGYMLIALSIFKIV